MNEVKSHLEDGACVIATQEWIDNKLGSLVNHKNGQSFEQYFSPYGKYKVISIGNYSKESRFIDNGVRISVDNYHSIKNFIPKKNDLTMILNDKTSTGEIIGRTLLIEHDDSFVINQRTICLSLCTGVSPHFFFYLLNSDITRKYIMDAAKPGTQIYINTPDVLGIPVRYPNDIEEQRRIAAALSDTDELIAALEKLIAKKLNIKQGAMQELLAGKRRLLGFSGEWVEKTLTDCSEILQGLTYTPKNVKSHGLLVLRSSNIQNESLSFDDCVYVDCSVDENRYVNKGDILICVRNGSSELIGKCAFVDKNYNATFGAFMSVLRSDMADYLFQLFRSGIVQKQTRNNSSATINQITKRDFNEITFSLPPTIAEQIAIAAILSDMDAEIGALTIKLNKLRHIKQGMMSKLLTGRIRLIEE